MHTIACGHVAVVRSNKVILNVVHSKKCRCVREVGSDCGNICFDGVCDCIHTGVRYKLLRHCLSEFRIDDGDVRSDLKVCDRVFDALLIISNNGKCRHLRCRSRCRRYSDKFCFLAKFRNSENLAHILKCALRILILDPHCLRSIDRRAAAHGDDPVRLELEHFLCTVHDCCYRRIRLDAFDKCNFHTGFFKISLRFLKETESLHAATADTDDGFFALEGLKSFESSFSMIQVAWISKSLHNIYLSCM